MQKKIYNFIQNILVAVAIFIVLFLLASRFLPKFNYGLYVIQSGSMQPTIKTGSIIIDKKQTDYQKGDIVTFLRGRKDLVTHRITETMGDSENVMYKTKGDANDTDDMFLAKKSSVLGKVVFAVPYFGYVIAFAKTKAGLILLIVIPALWFIFEEGKKIRNHFKKKKADEKEDAEK